MININDLFDITPDGKINLSTTALATPVFRRIYDIIEDKGVARKEIEYIIFKHHWKTPYNVYGSTDQRDAKVKLSLFNDKDYKIHPITEISEKEYAEELQDSEILQMLEAARVGVRYITSALLSLRETTPGSATLEMADKVNKIVEKLGNSVKSLDIIEKAAKANELATSKIRGDGELNLYEIPDLKR